MDLKTFRGKEIRIGNNIYHWQPLGKINPFDKNEPSGKYGFYCAISSRDKRKGK